MMQLPNAPQLSTRQSGFTLMEAIIAMVIMATAGVALLAWMSNTLSSLNRIEAARDRDEATMAALEYLSSINPSQRPEGEMDLGRYELQWTAETLEPYREGMGPRGGSSLFQVALYRLEVSVSDGDREYHFSVRQAGWDQFRQPALD